MKPRYLLLIIPVILINLSTVYSQTVSGITTPSNANGTYSDNGILNTKNSWKLIAGADTYYVFWGNKNGTDYWIINNNTSTAGNVFFFVASTASLPPSSGWTQGFGVGSPFLSGFALPVELTSFTASVSGSNVNLKWQTATEVNNYGFEVERKKEKVKSGWEKIGFVAGHGNSNSPHEYSFTDQPAGGTSFSYRLKQIDNDGHYKYYDAITVSLSSSTKAKLMQNSPNPFNPSTAIKFFIPDNSNVTIKIYDMLGREVTTLINQQSTAGYHIVYWNGRDSYGRDAASGVYLYRLTAGSFSETKKMLMMR